MAQLLKWFADIANSITGKWNLSEDATFAIIIGLIIISIAFTVSTYNFVKKHAGKNIALIAMVAVLLTTGFVTTTQIASFAEKIGVIKESSIGEGFVVDGDAFIDWVESKMPGADEGAGSWVPDKDKQDVEDWD